MPGSSGGASSQDSHGLLMVGAFVLYFLWWALPIVGVGADDPRMLLAFYTDEAIHVGVIQTALATHQFLLQFGNYGQLVFNTVLIPLALVQQVSPVSFHQTIFALRLVSFVAAIGALGATFYWLRPYGLLAAAFGIAAAVVADPIVLEMAVISHPDVPQLLFLVLALGALTRSLERRSWTLALWGAAFAGFAFACKFGGVLLAPLVALAALRADRPVDDVQQAGRGLRMMAAAAAVVALVASGVITSARFAAWFTADGAVDAAGAAMIDRTRRILFWTGAALVTIAAISGAWKRFAADTRLVGGLTRLVIAVVVAVLAFAVVSPGSIWRLSFVKGLYYESSRLSPDSFFASVRFLLQWLMIAMEVFGRGLLLLAVAGATLVVVRTARGGISRLWEGPGGPALILLVTMLAALSRARPGAPHYLMPMSLALAGLGVTVIVALREAIAAKVSASLANAVACALVLVVTVPMFVKSAELRSQLASRQESSDAIDLGRWMETALNTNALVVADFLTYLPPAFHDAEFVWGTAPDSLLDRGPRYLVSNRQIQALADATTVPWEPLAMNRGFRSWMTCGDLTLYAASTEDPTAMDKVAPPPGCRRVD